MKYQIKSRQMRASRLDISCTQIKYLEDLLTGLCKWTALNSSESDINR